MRTRLMKAILAVILSATWVAANAASDIFAGIYGNYRLADEHVIGINEFVMDGGERVALFADYSTGVVRRLFPLANGKFAVGPSFNTASPVELTVEVVKDTHGAITGIKQQSTNDSLRFAPRIDLKRKDVSFEDADATLQGTLILPTTPGPHPAIVLLHGSGPLTRFSFGPYPHFFASLGFAVLIYDKRGSGASSGVRLDASTAIVRRPTPYPQDLAIDALAALRLLQERDDIDPKRIGFWGSSEGGMLANYVAAKSSDVAFAINSSGFMEPLWETLRYQVRPSLRNSSTPETVIAAQESFVDLWLRVARTGQGWEEFQRRERETIATHGFWFFQSRGHYESVDQMRTDWDNVLSFDPLPMLAKVKCPVLGVFGELDTSTPAARTASNMQRTLTGAGHRDFATKIFPNAGHSLSELPAKARMAQGVFETLRVWLREHTTTTER